MMFDWRSRRYRGGSRWISAGLIVVAVGVSLPAPAAVGDAEASIIVVLAEDRTIGIDAEDRTILIPADDRTIVVAKEHGQL